MTRIRSRKQPTSSFLLESKLSRIGCRESFLVGVHNPSFEDVQLASAADLKSLPRTRRISQNYLLESLRRSVAFDHVAICGLDIDGFELSTGKSFDTDLPPLFVEKYVEAEWYARDPLIEAAKIGQKVLTDEVGSPSMPQELGEILSFFNLRNRALVPIGRQSKTFGGVLFTRSAPFRVDELAYLEFIARPLYEAVVQPLMDKFAAVELQLTAGEVNCLRHAELGLTSDEIAAELGYAAQTVNAYILSATRKLKANNRTHAIATALRRGLLG